MITIATCPCGRSHDAIAFARLAPIRGDAAVQARRCWCGREIEVSTLEADTASEIDRARYESANAYGRAAFELAMLRYARAASLPMRWDSFFARREEARNLRAFAKRLELILASFYRARELRSPKQRLGRNLVVVEGAVDACAETERAPAVRR